MEIIGEFATLEEYTGEVCENLSFVDVPLDTGLGAQPTLHFG